MYNDFLRALKFTLGYECRKLAIAEDLVDTNGDAQVVELDDTVNVDKVLASEEPSLVWKLHNFDEDPRDPLYMLNFLVGAKTTSDPSNYQMLEFISSVTEVFAVSSSFAVMDWSSDVAPTQKLGSVIVTASGVDRQLRDQASGARLVAVEARVVRFV